MSMTIKLPGGSSPIPGGQNQQHQVNPGKKPQQPTTVPGGNQNDQI